MIPRTMPSERVQRRIDRLLDQADQALESNQWQKALEVAEVVLGLDADNEDAQVFVGAAHRGLDAAGDEAPSPNEISDAEQLVAMRSDGSPSESPTSFVNGRYEVTGFLGEGGKKRVYLAHDTTLDRDVAFALIKAEGLDDASRQRSTREAQAMARLGANP
ncbi:MAG: hypothetical protein IIC93_04665, partial [Chloroflexi bacterium]|nr:hypothetical protein [Chloroflexota bacterium]